MRGVLLPCQVQRRRVSASILIFFKNLFLYLSYYVLSPMRNSVMTKLKNDLYNKILSLPIGYFTEQRKGDLISRMTNAASPINPHSQLRLCFTTTSITIATRNMVATSFHILNCLELYLKMPFCCKYACNSVFCYNLCVF